MPKSYRAYLVAGDDGSRGGGGGGGGGRAGAREGGEVIVDEARVAISSSHAPPPEHHEDQIEPADADGPGERGAGGDRGESLRRHEGGGSGGCGLSGLGSPRGTTRTKSSQQMAAAEKGKARTMFGGEELRVNVGEGRRGRRRDQRRPCPEQQE